MMFRTAMHLCGKKENTIDDPPVRPIVINRHQTEDVKEYICVTTKNSGTHIAFSGGSSPVKYANTEITAQTCLANSSADPA